MQGNLPKVTPWDKGSSWDKIVADWNVKLGIPKTVIIITFRPFQGQL